MELPTLYKKSSTGALQKWTISTDGFVITTRWGQVDGAIQETQDVIKSGKNAGKKNATTPEQQAELEAQAKWEKALKKGYVKAPDEALAGKVDEIIEGGVAPMLAHRFDEQGHKIVYPCYANPKLDGHRCVAVVEDGKATLWSRTRKPITGLPHIIAALEAKYPGVTVTLDGELYRHDYRDRFEELSSFIRTPEAKPGHEVVQFHIYDMVSYNLPFSARFDGYLKDAFDGDVLVGVEAVEIEDEDELMTAFERFLAQGYEGLMVRNAHGKYVNKRSYDLQKVKEFNSSEFTVVGVEEGRGKLAGHAIFVCSTEDGTHFRAKMKGETSKLKEYFENPASVLGRKLEVKYQGFTNKSQVPRFGVAMRFRDDL